MDEEGVSRREKKRREEESRTDRSEDTDNKKPACFKVEMESHHIHRLPKDFTLGRAEDTESEESESEGNTPSPDGLENADRNIFPVKVNGKPAKATLDSGAQINIIGGQLVADLQLKIEILDYEIRVRAFNEEIESHKNFARLNVQLGSSRVSICALVVPKAGNNLLLSIKTLRLLRVLWDFHLSKLFVRRVDNSLEAIETVETNWNNEVRKLFPKLCQPGVNENPIMKVAFQLKRDAKLVQKKPYLIKGQKLEWIRKKIKELLEIGVIRRSSSNYASPCVIVVKENGDFRLTQDYRAINKQTDLDPFLFPSVDQIIDGFGGKRFFTKIDLKDGFWQIGLTPETIKYTAFVTPTGHYEMTRLPQGWKNSPAKFQRVMCEILEDLLEPGRVEVYIDDIICGAETQEENWKITVEVLKQLEKNGLRINPIKCKFNVESVIILGRKIDGKTKSIKEESVKKLMNIARPHNLKTIQCFTGLTGYFRHYIPKYNDIVRPLDNLKKKDVDFVWDDKCEHAYQTLKKIISTNPVLNTPQKNLPFELHCDASYFGTGAILYQWDKNEPRRKRQKAIGYYSYSFNKSECNYKVTEKEGLAVVKAIKYFRSYLEGTKFTVHTDHKALVSIFEEGELKDRLGRWQTFLHDFDFEIIHRKGDEMVDADAISRLCVGAEHKVNSVNVESKLIFNNGKYNVPGELKEEVLKLYHDDPYSGGHGGIRKTIEKLKQRFEWKNLKQEVEKYVASCPTCQIYKADKKPKGSKMSLPPHSKEKFHTIHLDFAELAKKGEGTRTTKSFIVAVDEGTRFCFTGKSKEDSSSVIKLLESLNLDDCKTVVSDNGKGFTSQQIKDWCAEKGINWITTSSYHPAGNGMAERKIRDLKTYMKMYESEMPNWTERLKHATQWANNSFCRALGCTPSYKAYGVSPTLPADKKLRLTKLCITKKSMNAEETDKYRNRMKLDFDRLHNQKDQNLREGEKILIKLGQGKQAHFKGPYVITKSSDTTGKPYVIFKREDGSTDSCHLSNLVKWKERKEETHVHK